jgi:receptor protein-tyrosine kinase
MDIIERAASKLRAAAPEKVEVLKDEAIIAKAAAVHPAESLGAGRRSRREVIDLARMREMGFIIPDQEPTRTAEEFRIVKRQILLKAFGVGDMSVPNGNLILVTSAQPREGKTFCAINLAMSIASERDLTVLLVDADVARPAVLKGLGLPEGKGLVDVILDDKVELADCLIRTNIENLSILPAGRAHPLATELLASDRMGDIVEEIAKRYPDRVIIFDSSPVLANSAPSVLAMHVGQVLFVAEADRTRETQMQESLSLLSGCKNINLLLNKSPFSGGKEKFGSYYGYGYERLEQ